MIFLFQLYKISSNLVNIMEYDAYQREEHWREISK